MIQKDLDERVNTAGEMSEKVAWFKKCILNLKSSDECQKSDQTNEINSLQKGVEALKEKQQSEMSDLLARLDEVQCSEKTAENTKTTTTG